MFSDYFSAVLLILFAEMGDKTQFLAMAFATKYPIRKILLGVFIGAFLNHGLAILFGRAILALIPADIVGFVAGLMFIYFGFKSLEIEDEEVENKENKYGPVVTVALAFFLGELGDKTQLAALGLSVDSTYMFMVLLGTVTGMILTSALGIFIGLKLGKTIPEDKLKLSAFLIFIFFGIQKLYVTYLFKIDSIFLVILSLMTVALIVYTVGRFNKQYKSIQESAFLKQAEALKKTRERIELSVMNMCKGTEHCGVCEGKECLVGYMRFTLTHRQHEITKEESLRINALKNKNFDQNEARMILDILDTYYADYPSERDQNENLKALYILAEKIAKQ